MPLRVSSLRDWNALPPREAVRAALVSARQVVSPSGSGVIAPRCCTLDSVVRQRLDPQADLSASVAPLSNGREKSAPARSPAVIVAAIPCERRPGTEMPPGLRFHSANPGACHRTRSRGKLRSTQSAHPTHATVAPDLPTTRPKRPHTGAGAPMCSRSARELRASSRRSSGTRRGRWSAGSPLPRRNRRCGSPGPRTPRSLVPPPGAPSVVPRQPLRW